MEQTTTTTLQGRHNGHDDVSNHQPHDCFFNHLFRRRSQKTSNLRFTVWRCHHEVPWTLGTRWLDAVQESLGPLQWRHNGRDSVSNHQPHDCLLNRLFRLRSKKTLKLRVTGLCAWNSPGTGEFPAQMASYAENVSIWWRHHAFVNPSLVNV